MNRRATAFAPASIGNVAVGFDILGQVIDGVGDRVTVERTDSGQVRIREISGVVSKLPLEPNDNTAGRALLQITQRIPAVGFDVWIEKGIALGSGMGGSAASAVAALVAANALLHEPLPLEVLYDFAMEGESVASGSRHGDNVAPMLLGGLVLAPAKGAPIRLPVPKGLACVVVHPHFVLETRVARAALREPYLLKYVVDQTESLALFMTGCFTNDLSLVRRGLRDVIAEPRRASLIPGFHDVKKAALDHGAIGSSISGAGPSVFAWCENANIARACGSVMQAAFGKHHLQSDVYVSPVDGAAARVESCSA